MKSDDDRPESMADDLTCMVTLVVNYPTVSPRDSSASLNSIMSLTAGLYRSSRSF